MGAIFQFIGTHTDIIFLCLHTLVISYVVICTTDLGVLAVRLGCNAAAWVVTGDLLLVSIIVEPAAAQLFFMLPAIVAIAWASHAQQKDTESEVSEGHLLSVAMAAIPSTFIVMVLTENRDSNIVRDILVPVILYSIVGVVLGYVVKGIMWLLRSSARRQHDTHDHDRSLV